MSHLDYARYAMGAMGHRSLRSWLTVAGIVIGIAAIVILISVGYGINDYMASQLESFGSNFISISAGKPGGGMSMGPFMSTSSSVLTTNDAQAVKGVAGVESVYTILGTRSDIEYRGDLIGGVVAGASAGVFKDFEMMFKIDEGRAFTDADSRVVVIGDKVAHDSFETDITIGRTLVIGNVSYRVVGIFKKSESSPFPIDSIVFMPYNDAQIFMSGIKAPNQADMLILRTEPGANPDEVAQLIKQRLWNTRRVTEETQDFKITTAASSLESIGAITGVLGLFLGGIAAIALVVGGVGIANTMFMSVSERTREIGVMKAVGAKEEDILEIFLLESGMLGMIGGIIGVAIGVAASLLMNYFGIPSSLRMELLAFAMLFALVMGMVSGYFPARRAARMEPVEALGFG